MKQKLQEPKRPYPPYSGQYAEKVEREYIYSFVESLQDDEQYDEDEEGEEEIPQKPIGEIDLAWLISQIPKGVTPGQIKIDCGYTASSMSYEDHYVRFYYEVMIPARDDEFEAYRRDLAKYEDDMVAYQAAIKVNKIKDMEETLARLKKG